MYYLLSPTDEEIWEEIMQEVREEQARRKAEGKTAKYKSLKKRSRKRGCSSDTDIAAKEDKKKAENNEVGCPSGTNIAAEEDIKNNEQQGAIFPNDKPQEDHSSGSNTKLEVRKSQKAGFTSSCCSSPQPHSSASQGLLSESEEKKGVQSKRNLHKTVRFQIDEQPEAPDSLSVLSSETLYRETAFIGEDEVATKEKMRDENSCKFCFVFQPPMPKGQGLNFFSCMICICFQANNYIVRLLGTLSYKH